MWLQSASRSAYLCKTVFRFFVAYSHFITPELWCWSTACWHLWVKRIGLINSTLFFAGHPHLHRGSSEEPDADLAEPLDLQGTSREMITHRVCLCSQATLEFVSVPGGSAAVHHAGKQAGGLLSTCFGPGGSRLDLGLVWAHLGWESVPQHYDTKPGVCCLCHHRCPGGTGTSKPFRLLLWQ